MASDGILRLQFERPYIKKRFKDYLQYPTAYHEVAVEPDHKNDTSLWLELTFWAVQLLTLIERNKNKE